MDRFFYFTDSGDYQKRPIGRVGPNGMIWEITHGVRQREGRSGPSFETFFVGPASEYARKGQYSERDSREDP